MRLAVRSDQALRLRFVPTGLAGGADLLTPRLAAGIVCAGRHRGIRPAAAELSAGTARASRTAWSWRWTKPVARRRGGRCAGALRGGSHNERAASQCDACNNKGDDGVAPHERRLLEVAPVAADYPADAMNHG